MISRCSNSGRDLRQVIVFLILISGLVALSYSNGLKPTPVSNESSSTSSTTTTTTTTQQQDPQAGEERYQLAFEESNGFFRDIPEDQWLVKTKILRRRILNPVKLQRVKMFWQSNYNPQFACEHTDYFGQPGLGGVWLCDPHRIPKQDCVIYSFYAHHTNFQDEEYEQNYGTTPFEFEQAVQKRLPFCTIHIFDTIDLSTNITRAGLNATFHKLMISSQDNQVDQADQPNKPLKQIMNDLGHKQITVLRMDYEGMEWFMQEQIASVDILQLSFQIHRLVKGQRDIFWTHLLQAGYTIFHKDPVLFSGGLIIDFSLLKLSPALYNNKTSSDESILPSIYTKKSNTTTETETPSFSS